MEVTKLYSILEKHRRAEQLIHEMELKGNYIKERINDSKQDSDNSFLWMVFGLLGVGIAYYIIDRKIANSKKQQNESERQEKSD